MLTFKANIVLHENQRVIDKSEARFKVIKAGKRFGKTKWAVYACVREAARRLGSTIWYVAPTYRQAKSIAWKDLLNVCPRELVKRKLESELMVELYNGSRIYLIGADNEDSLRGTAIDVLVMDEAAYIKEHVWPSILSGQLLGSKGQSVAYFISSPNRTGRNWFTAFYEEANRRMLNGDKSWAAFYFTIFDNPTLNKEEVEMVKQQCTEDMWQTEYLAIESANTGPLVPEFNYEKHVYADENLPGPLLRARGIDWGIAHPTTCLWASVHMASRKVWVTKEFYKTDYLIHQSANAIKQITGSEPVDISIIDPSCNKRNSQTPRTDREEFARYGVYCLPGDNGDRGYHIMRMFFKNDLIMIHKDCRNLISELRLFQVGDKEGDDCLDPLRYILVRVHDYMFGGKMFDPEASFVRPTTGYSLFDPDLFPKKEEQYSYEGL